jgi:hypothetical protein
VPSLRIRSDPFSFDTKTTPIRFLFLSYTHPPLLHLAHRSRQRARRFTRSASSSVLCRIAACRRFVIETINSHTRQDQHASYAAPPPPNLTLFLHFPTSISPLFLIEPDVQQNKEEDLRGGYWILDTDYNNDCFEVSQLSMLENEGVNLEVIVCVLFVSSHTILH